MSEELSELIDKVVVASDGEQERVISNIVANQEPEEVALLLEALPFNQRLDSWENVPQEEQLAILVAMRSDPRESLLDEMPLESFDMLFQGMEAEDLVELSESLPSRLVDRALRAMDQKQRNYFEGAKQYSEDLAGYWADHHLLVLPQNAKVRDGLRLLRREIPVYADTIFLINRAGHFSEALRISRIMDMPDHIPLVDLSEESIAVIKASDSAVDSALKVQKSVFTALPIVDEYGVLLGRMDIGTSCQLANEYYERQLMAGAGMDEDEDLFSPIVKSAKNRAIWLGINLLTAFLASWFIGLFEATLQQVVALAVLMPIVASMGGIAGSQTLTLMIRGHALGQITNSNFRDLLKKEVGVGFINGLVWSLIIGGIVSVWFADPMIGIVIGLAIMVNIVVAAITGAYIPVILNKLELDPALSGSVILTTGTDVVGFVAFLGLGTILLM